MVRTCLPIKGRLRYCVPSPIILHPSPAELTPAKKGAGEEELVHHQIQAVTREYTINIHSASMERVPRTAAPSGHSEKS